MNVKIVVGEKGIAPSRNSEDDAGHDLYASEDIIIQPMSRDLVHTDISMEIPSSHFGHVMPRSGLAYKNGIQVMAGVIDSNYRSEIMVLLYNTDPTTPFVVKKGHRIAQIVIQKINTCSFEICYDLSETSRGSKGFGSSGI